MNKKVRRILFTFLFFLSVFLLVGCGKITTTTTKDNTVVTTTTQNQGDNSGETTSHEYDYSKRGDTTLYVHYLRYKGDYTGWDLWAWDYAPINGAGAGYKFVASTDEFGGVVASLPVKRGITEVGFIIRQGGDDWTGKDIERDRIVFIPEDSTMDNPVHIYVLENTVEFTVNEVAKVKAKLLNASFKNEQTIIANSTTEMDESTIKLYKGDSELSIASKTLSSDKMTVTIVMSEKVDYTKDYNVYAKFEEDSTVQATFEGLYDYQGFGEAFNYDGELGVSVSESSTIFRLWAPVSTDVKLNIYSTGTAITDSDDKHPGTDTPDEVIQMVKGEKGVWSYTADSNMHGKYYTYSVTTSGSESEVMDPYAYSCGVNGRRGLVVDFSQINPTGWEYDNRPDSVVNENDAIIYEMHVRDLTCSSTWGGGRYKKGTFLALTETGTKYKSGNMTVTTGFDHIKELGVNTVQILPFFDWSDNVDETDLNNSAGKYSWGYMPVNYNCLEGSYSTNPYDGFNRIKEFKQMVMAYTEAGIRINMDVVYNHMANGGGSSFNLIVPGYFFRTDENGNFTNGSGCGNETASERYMMSKFMVDSCEFWAYEYNISGFRFDLMGLHDTDTMNAIASTVKTLDSSIMVYGEPWTGGSTPLSGDRQAKIENIDKMPNVGTFNDRFRDAVKGDAGYNKSDWGWVQGDQDGDEYNKIISGIYGNFAAGWGNPTQVINYVACHDNNTLHDKLDLTTNASGGKWTTAQIIAMAKQAYTLVLTSQGIPFILNGDEFLRTKTKEDGTYDENSYNSPDSVNAIDWSLKVTYNDYYNYIKALIALRKEHHGLFCSTTVNESGLAVTNHPWNNEWIVYTINNNDSSDSYKKLLVVMKNTDASYSDVNISSISGTWKLYYSSAGAAKNTNTYSTFAMNGREVYIFYSES